MQGKKDSEQPVVVFSPKEQVLPFSDTTNLL